MQVLVKEPELKEVGEAIVQKYYMAVDGVKAVKGHHVRDCFSPVLCLSSHSIVGSVRTIIQYCIERVGIAVGVDRKKCTCVGV